MKINDSGHTFCRLTLFFCKKQKNADISSTNRNVNTRPEMGVLARFIAVN